ncbi:hypothetical protein Tco_0971145 [Tanacetum coccineum]
MDELPHERFNAMQLQIDEFYPNTEDAQQDKDATLNALELAPDAMIAYEANQNSGNGFNNETSGSAGGLEHTAHSCSYKEFLTFKPQSVGLNAAYETTWKELKQVMID